MTHWERGVCIVPPHTPFRFQAGEDMVHRRRKARLWGGDMAGGVSPLGIVAWPALVEGPTYSYWRPGGVGLGGGGGIKSTGVFENYIFFVY